MATAQEIMAGFNARHPSSKKPRINWKAEIKKERNRVLDEAISSIKNEMRGKPSEWHRGYYSAITQLELLKDGIR